MGSLTFINNKNFALSSNNLVYEPDEVNALASILEQATHLNNWFAEEQNNIELANQSGYDEGYENGQSAGYEAALEHIATKLVVLTKEANAARDELQVSAADIALKIVEKIAIDLGPRPTIAALAKTAAKDISPQEPIVLRVCPDNVDYMNEQLFGDEASSSGIVSVTADTSLNETDCVLETEFGRIKADLKTQLKVLRDNFYGS